MTCECVCDVWSHGEQGRGWGCGKHSWDAVTLVTCVCVVCVCAWSSDVFVLLWFWPVLPAGFCLLNLKPIFLAGQDLFEMVIDTTFVIL